MYCVDILSYNGHSITIVIVSCIIKNDNMINVKYITAHDFDKTKLNYNGFSIVECINKNNALRITMESVLFRLKNSTPSQIKHLRIDTLKNPIIVEQFHVMHEPSYLIFFNGDFIDRIEGIVSFSEFSFKMNEHIESLITHF